MHLGQLTGGNESSYPCPCSKRAAQRRVYQTASGLEALYTRGQARSRHGMT